LLDLARRATPVHPHRGRRTADVQYYTQHMSRSSHVHPPAPLLVVIPAHNEAESLAELLPQIQSRGTTVLVVSDASRDATAEVARAHGARVLQLPVQLGAWGATQAGLRFALRHGFRHVVTLDADGQHEPACIGDLLAAQRESGAEVVIGTFPERLSRARLLAWRWFRALTGLRVEDLTSGFRCYGPRAIEVLASAEATLLDYQDVGVLLLLRKHGLAVRETPVQMYPRRNGRSKVFASWLLVAHYMLQTTVLCLSRVGRLSLPRRRYADAPT